VLGVHAVKASDKNTITISNINTVVKHKILKNPCAIEVKRNSSQTRWLHERDNMKIFAGAGGKACSLMTAYGAS
jgi:hypothetical protein